MADEAGRSLREALVDARTRLAGFWNAWFTDGELERAREMANTASEQECQAELDRLYREIDSRVQQWRRSQ